MKKKETTHFGYQTVLVEEKKERVREVFESVASRYDLMNNLMSFGIHHIWKKITIACSGFRPGQTILDLAGGSGDLSRLIHQKLKGQGLIVLADINRAMIEVGRDRLLDEGIGTKVAYVQADGQSLPFQNNSFDGIVIGFGLRNFTDQPKALKSLYDCCKPGGEARDFRVFPASTAVN